MIIEKQGIGRVNIVFKQTHNESVSPNNMWIGTLKGNDGTGLTWNRVCTATVEDKVNDDVTSLLDTTKATAENIIYTVKNGWCNVKVNSIKPLSSATKVNILPDGTLPKTNGYMYANLSNWNATSSQNILVRVGVKGELTIWCASGNENVSYYGSFSYPVAE